MVLQKNVILKDNKIETMMRKYVTYYRKKMGQFEIVFNQASREMRVSMEEARFVLFRPDFLGEIYRNREKYDLNSGDNLTLKIQMKQFIMTNIPKSEIN